MTSSKLVSALTLFICIPSVFSCPSFFCILYRCLLRLSIFHVVCMFSMYHGSPVPNSLLYECILLHDINSKWPLCSDEVLGAVSVGNE